jgi:hypothetical protein
MSYELAIGSWAASSHRCFPADQMQGLPPVARDHRRSPHRMGPAMDWTPRASGSSARRGALAEATIRLCWLGGYINRPISVMSGAHRGLLRVTWSRICHRFWLVYAASALGPSRCIRSQDARGAATIGDSSVKGPLTVLIMAVHIGAPDHHPVRHYWPWRSPASRLDSHPTVFQ